MKRVAFISTVLPFPVDVGKKVVLSGLLHYLFERYGPEYVTYIMLGHPNDEGSARKSLPCKLFALKGPSVLDRLWNVFWSVLVRGKTASRNQWSIPLDSGAK